MQILAYYNELFWYYYLYLIEKYEQLFKNKYDCNLRSICETHNIMVHVYGTECKEVNIPCRYAITITNVILIPLESGWKMPISNNHFWLMQCEKEVPKDLRSLKIVENHEIRKMMSSQEVENMPMGLDQVTRELCIPFLHATLFANVVWKPQNFEKRSSILLKG